MDRIPERRCGQLGTHRVASHRAKILTAGGARSSRRGPSIPACPSHANRCSHAGNQSQQCQRRQGREAHAPLQHCPVLCPGTVEHENSFPKPAVTQKSRGSCRTRTVKGPERPPRQSSQHPAKATLIQKRVEVCASVTEARWIVAIDKPASLKSPGIG